MGGKQLGFDDDEQGRGRMGTRRERFLTQMEAVVPWESLIDLIEHQDPRSSTKGRSSFLPAGDYDADSPDAAVLRPQQSGDGGCTEQAPPGQACT